MLQKPGQYGNCSIDKNWVSRFNEITLAVGGKPLVSQEIFPKLRKYTKEITSGWYYINRTDTREKTSQLININRQLNLGLKIEVGDFKGSKNPPLVGSTRRKNKLPVTMPDGQKIDYEGYVDGFMECVYQLGPRLVSARANYDLSANCPLLTTTNPTGKRKQVDESLYLAIPPSAKEAGKILRLIATRLGLINAMKIEIIPLASNQNNR